MKARIQDSREQDEGTCTVRARIQKSREQDGGTCARESSDAGIRGTS